MKLAIMQPYFMPYLGYWQLMNAVDKFVVYDDIQFTKKGWIHRNRFLKNGKAMMFSLPLKKDSDYLYISQRVLADDSLKMILKIKRSISEAYRKAPYFEEVFPMLEDILDNENKTLFDYILESIKRIKEYLCISTELVISSSLEFDNDLKSQDKVIAICKACDAEQYINPFGGVELYTKEVFNEFGLELRFHEMNKVEYPQFNNIFESSLSIIDVMMFNSREEVKGLLNEYSLI